ncbi:hypothetical protein TSAR_009559 [Trichomalopsis sarcophagae]|uniref:Uncharacterized protein n=1 Tax=Trichomalopsis sarcophagae TaxID=543379 RepID=A0A232ESZ3_9HYME|nr:hypothetical protein TSAR_009559 [Trichomalopsis sarcophagae]
MRSKEKLKLDPALRSYLGHCSSHSRTRGGQITEKMFQDVINNSKHSDNWYDPHGEIRALHVMNPLRKKFVRDLLANVVLKKQTRVPLEDIKLLDVGYHRRILSKSLAIIGANITRLDASKELISIARQHVSFDKYLSSNLNDVHTSIEDCLQKQKEKFNAAVASEILEHDGIKGYDFKLYQPSATRFCFCSSFKAIFEAPPKTAIEAAVLATVPATIGSAIRALFGTPTTDIEAAVEDSVPAAIGTPRDVNGAIDSLVMGLRNDSSGTRKR